jgi:hypothetical protein
MYSKRAALTFLRETKYYSECRYQNLHYSQNRPPLALRFYLQTPSHYPKSRNLPTGSIPITKTLTQFLNVRTHCHFNTLAFMFVFQNPETVI